jgi:NAD(P)-dependent dehydrogenase (short-subunit alcohol dehydrogenase family)
MASIFRDRLLAGKVAFITGGGSGIGLRIAERFSEHGAQVMLAGRRAEKLERAQAGIGQRGGVAAISPLDVRDYPALEAALDRTHHDLGPIDIVVAAAAGNFPAPALGMSANGFKAVIDIDLLGTFNTLRAAHGHLRRPGASVLAISAAHATIPMPFQAHVCAAKAGIELLLKTLAIEWGPIGVRCNSIVPGQRQNQRAPAPFRHQGRTCRPGLVSLLGGRLLYNRRKLPLRWWLLAHPLR